MRASRRGLASTYTAVVLMLLCPAISAIAFRSIPRSARRVINVRLPLCDEAPDMPASRYSALRKRAMEAGVIAPPFWLGNKGACDALVLSSHRASPYLTKAR